MQSDLWRRSRFGKAYLSFFLALAVAIGVGAWLGVERGQAGSAAMAAAAIPDLPAPSRAADASALPATGSFAPLIKKIAPAVVSVKSERTAEVPAMPQGFPFFFGQPGDQEPQERRQRGQGSGAIISPDGYILTNHHVVADADEVTVVLNDEREFDAEVVGSDEKTDVALLKVDATNLPTVPLGNSDAVEVGDIVLAIGNPFGIGQTVTMGIVGATGRQFGITGGGYEDFIQTDAAINPGNSGGPLINTSGELIGVNTAILSRSGGNNGVGFAVPVNLAHHVTRQLVENGRVVRGYMGVGIQDINPALAKQFGAPDSKGALVTSVEKGGPAEKAGFEQGDVIRAINDKPVADTRELRLGVANTPPGADVKVDILRDGQPRTLNITLGEFPEDPSSISRSSGGSSGDVLSGVSVQDLTPQLADRLGIDTSSGVIVTRVRPDSDAADAGLLQGDLILEVNRKPVKNVSDLRSALSSAEGDSILLLVETRGASRFVVIER